jgi:hypothetical protein
VFATAVPALAQDPTAAQYDNGVHQVSANVGGGTQGGVGDASPASTSQSSGLQESVGGLPFTGLDVISLLAVALALTSVGFALRRMTASRSR